MSGHRVVPRQYIYPFILVTSLFALWGFANDVTNPLVKAFREIFLISNAQSSLVQVAFYGGYATMAIPAALVIRKFSFKSGLVVGLMLYAANEGYLKDVDVEKVGDFESALLAFVHSEYGETMKNIVESGDWSDELEAVFKEAIEKFKSTQTW